jgi:hypothetical protein
MTGPRPNSVARGSTCGPVSVADFREMLRTKASLKFLIAGCLLSLSSGCATVGRDPFAQAVFVKTDPPGAQISVEGKEIATSPAYVLVPRKKEPEIVLSLDGETKTVKVPTKYRWSESFASNFWLYIAAPIGWGVDLLTGAAWNPEDPPLVSLRKPGDEATYPLPDPKRVAIEPPLANSQPLSDRAGHALEQVLQQEQAAQPYYQLLPFDETLPQFIHRGSDFDARGSYDNERNLYARLHPDAIWRSKLSLEEGDYVLNAELQDVRTKEILDNTKVQFDSGGSLARTWAWAYDLLNLPNTLTVSNVNQGMTLERANGLQPIELRRANASSWVEQGLNYLSALSLTNIPTYRTGRPARWQLSAYPLVLISRKVLSARGAPDLEDREFYRWWASIGYGPELGYQVSRSYIYANFFVHFAWTEISWRDRNEDHSITKTFVSPAAEIGYLYSLTDNWSVRGFVSTITENADAWKAALTRSSNLIGGPNEFVGDTMNTTVGISFGYSFEPFITSAIKLIKPKGTQSPDALRNITKR